MLNPYAVTTTITGENQLHPIHFGGLATRDDLTMALLDAPPKTGFARFQFPATLVVLFGLWWLIGTEFSDFGETPPSIIWMLAGFLLLPGWIYVTRRLGPSHRKRVERINVMAAHQKRTRGWLDEEVVVICDDDSAMRARWRFFGAPLIFPTHLMLPLTSDLSRRVVLPWRFFCSPEDVRLLCKTLKENNSQMVNVPPKDGQLAELMDQHEHFVAVDVDRSRRWNAEDWPLASSPAGQFDCTIDLAATISTRRFAIQSAFGIAVIMVWYFLPIWVASVSWFVCEYWVTGDWDFVHERLFSSLLVLVPAAAAWLFFLYFIVVAVFRSRQIQKQPFKIRLRSSGVHLAHDSFESWFGWSSVKGVITEAECTGWISEESADEIRFPKICFDDEPTFERFKSTLQSFADGRSPAAAS